MKTTAFFFSCIFASFVLFAFDLDLPKDWHAAGSKPESYDMGLDKTGGRDGNPCATIQSKDKKIKGFGTLMQGASPNKYLGKRVRMTGYIKSADVVDWAGMWFRVDKDASSIAFDNMETRSLKGNNDWKKYEIVLDIAGDASQLAYGVLLSGTGKVWFDDIQFEIVGKEVPTTDMYHPEPQNLNFDK
jgi:hypothetical protein